MGRAAEHSFPAVSVLSSALLQQALGDNSLGLDGGGIWDLRCGTEVLQMAAR